MKHHNIVILIFISLLTCTHVASAQTSSNRVGTTAANFLELGFDPQGTAMGDACVSTVNNLSSIYWNPAGLGFMEHNEVYFSYQSWLVDTHTYLVAAGFVAPSLGTFAISVMGMNYGEMEVTTLELQEGTGEKFTPADMAINLSYARNLTSWFGFGATVKYIHSSIFHSTASATAVDMGAIIKTGFFSSSNDKEGLRIGMSLSNYGTRMRYGGLDLLRSIDISPDETGNYKDVEVEFKTDSWELPLLFRVGISLDPIVLTKHRLTLAADALHANNNNESVNLGAIYTLSMPGLGKVFLRGGYRGMFMENSEFGPTYGFGFLLQTMPKRAIQLNYAFRDIGLLGTTHVMGFSFLF
ncbi:PorV/PorQ family protein [candidate division KSB1 bacterium]|nr:PorV/PorQ family protein [candidate division KSB1 bacterium]